MPKKEKVEKESLDTISETSFGWRFYDVSYTFCSFTRPPTGLPQGSFVEIRWNSQQYLGKIIKKDVQG